MSITKATLATLLAVTQTGSQADSEKSTPETETRENAGEETAPKQEDSNPEIAPFGQEEEQAKEPSESAVAALEMIDAALKKVDPEIKREGNLWQLKVGESMVLIASDPLAERMRIMVPIVQADQLDQERLVRLMQANFDSALDARYAISRNILWGTFIHPLVPLSEKELLSGLAQTITVAATYGSSYTSGAVIYGGGDSQGIQADELFEQLRQLGEEEARKTV